MKKFFKSYKKVLALVLSLVAMFVVMGPATFAPVDAENLKLNFNLIADTHIDPFSENSRGIIFAKGLRDMAKATVKSDALVIAGDLTDTGFIYEYGQLSFFLKAISNADNLVLEMGNHDIRWKEINYDYPQPYEIGAAKYLAFLANATGIEEDNVYFHKVIKDCYFIALNTEEVRDMETKLSTAQLTWLDTLLAQAADDGNPIFIVNHQPIKGIGEDAAPLMEILQKYNGTADVFFINGHWHMGFYANTITSDGTLHFVDLPCYGKTPGGNYNKTGSGYQVELYEDQILFRARNFAAGEWESEYDYTIDLMD